MLRRLLFALSLIAAVSAVSCRVHHVVVVHDAEYTSGPREEVIVTEQAPADRVEVIPVAPSANHVWIQGYWTRHDGAWFWVAGGWHPRPRHGAEWVVGHWEARPGRWVWVPGHWRYV